jgi:uncharacterized protein (DUF1501 family)
MKRRQALHTLALGATGIALSGRLYAAPVAGPKFLLVFLRGGYDCANALVPYSSSLYYEARPTLAIRAPRADDPAGALAIDGDWALAPALRTGLDALWTDRQAAFVPFAGTEDVSRSHFETQDDIELGQPAGNGRDYRSGFLARLATEVTGARPIAFTDALPLSFAGASDLPSVSIRNVSRTTYDARQSQLFDSLYAGQPLEAAVSEGLALRSEVNAQLAQEMQDSARSAAAPKGFELEAARIARLMREQYSIGFVDLGGWDTHVNEGAADGALARNLKSLAQGLATLRSAFGPDWSRTVVVVVSEFGRTFRENGNRGTDHGHGSVYWVLGGGVRGARVVGAQVRITPATLFQNRDYPVLNNYRAVLGGLFQRLWGLNGEAVQRVFPRTTPADLGLV